MHKILIISTFLCDNMYNITINISIIRHYFIIYTVILMWNNKSDLTRANLQWFIQPKHLHHGSNLIMTDRYQAPQWDHCIIHNLISIIHLSNNLMLYNKKPARNMNTPSNQAVFLKQIFFFFHPSRKLFMFCQTRPPKVTPWLCHWLDRQAKRRTAHTLHCICTCADMQVLVLVGFMRELVAWLLHTCKASLCGRPVSWWWKNKQSSQSPSARWRSEVEKLTDRSWPAVVRACQSNKS